MQTRTIPIITGPTGSGKTGLAATISPDGGEAVSADSRQIYRFLNIGTAKPTPDELAALPHHLVDFVDPNESYSAGRFRSDAEDAIDEILARNGVPVVVGGTGFYLRALSQGMSPIPSIPDDVTEAIRRQMEEIGAETLHRELIAIDPGAAAHIEVTDRQRIVRALSVFRHTGTPLSTWWTTPPEPPRYRFRWLGVRWPREVLRDRLRQRVRGMIRSGLEDEVRELLERGLGWDLNAMRTVGYRDWRPRFEGNATVEEVEERIFFSTAQYAKRQMTWFRGVPDIEWLDGDVPDLERRAKEWLDRVISS